SGARFGPASAGTYNGAPNNVSSQTKSSEISPLFPYTTLFRSHGGGDDGLLRGPRALAGARAVARGARGRAARRDGGVRAARRDDRAGGVSAAARGRAARAAHHRDRRLAAAPERRAARVRRRPE